MLACDRSHDEQAQAAALPADRDAGWNAVEAFKDPFELGRRNADAVIRHADGDIVVMQRLELDDNLGITLRVLDRVVDEIPDRRLQLLGVAQHGGVRRVLDVLERLGGEVKARPRQLDALARELPQVEGHPRAAPQHRSGRAGAEDLLDRVQQAIAVLEHDPVELAPLDFVDLARLQCLEIEADRSDRRLQFVRHRVDERVVLLVAPDLADQEDGVHDAERDDDEEKDRAEHDQHPLAPVQDQPADIQRDRRRHQADPEHREGYGLPPAARYHRTKIHYGHMAMTRRHMSMLRSYTPADALTIGNAACGTIAIFLCLDYLASDERRFLWTAFVLLPLALVCDVLDGYVARLNRKRQSVLGADLDSLADVISFGVAPAVLGFTLGLRGGWDMLVLTYFVVCGVSRLARFNVTAEELADVDTGKVKYFEGTPIPTSILIVMLLGIAMWLGRTDAELWFGEYRVWFAGFHPLTLLYGLSGSAMISGTLRIPKP